MRALVPMIGSLALAVMAEERVPAERIGARTFPSVFMAWSPAEHVAVADPLDVAARHDLIFNGPTWFKLRWAGSPHEGLCTAFATQSVAAARAFRADLLRRNSNLVLLAEIRYRDAHADFLPPDSPWWMRDAAGKRKPGWEEGGYYLLNFHDAEFRRQVARRAAACVKSRALDGVMFDWWHEYPAEDAAARLDLLREVRAAIGADALILVNGNHEKLAQSAPFINGQFMECYRTKTPDDWHAIAESLRFGEQHFRAPHINCVETWYRDSRRDLPLLRATTTLALTMSDGYCLFSDPNPLPSPDHLHDWYDFWDKGLGRPLRAGALRADGAWEREFSGGTAIYNPPGNAAVQITVPHESVSRASGVRGLTFTVPPGDGDLLLRPAGVL